MRTKPFEAPETSEEKPAGNTETTSPGKETHRISLKDRISEAATRNEDKPQAEEITPEKGAENKEPAQPNPEGQPTPAKDKAEAENDTSGFDKFQDKAAESLEDWIDNPQEFSEMVVGFFNQFRMFFAPSIYEGLMYPGQERNDIREVVNLAIANEKKNLPPDTGFNNYYKRLYSKWKPLQATITGASYTDSEIKKFAAKIAKRIKDVGVAKFIAKYEIFFFAIYLEMKHAQNIGQYRTNDFIMKKFG